MLVQKGGKEVENSVGVQNWRKCRVAGCIYVKPSVNTKCAKYGTTM